MVFFKPRTLVTLSSLLAATATCQSSSSSKRGLALPSTPHPEDTSTLLLPSSPITWYYTWSAYPSSSIPSSNDNSTTATTPFFTPMLHSLDTLSDDISALPSPSKEEEDSDANYLLTFNEPDTPTSSGGSSISPSSAADAYRDQIAPLRDSGSSSWKIAHPAVSGSERGLKWLKEFREACGEDGCPLDFLAIHWYGPSEGLEGWLESVMEEVYDDYQEDEIKIWVTELGIPDEGAEDTQDEMEAMLDMLDGNDQVERYAWFGAFRVGSDEAKGWTGSGVAMLDSGGGLTELGVEYLGGEDNGFEVGDKGEEGAAAAVFVERGPGLMVRVALALTVVLIV